MDENSETCRGSRQQRRGTAADLDLLVALLAPLPVGPHDGGLIHLVDGHDDLGDAQGLGQLRVLPRLPAALEARLELGLGASRHSAKVEDGQAGALMSHVQCKDAGRTRPGGITAECQG